MRGFVSLCHNRSDCGEKDQEREGEHRPRVVLGWKVRFVGAGPDLEEVNLLGTVTLLAMPDPGTS